MPAKNYKNNPLCYITRVDNEKKGEHAWRFSITREKEDICKYFNDNAYGSKKKSLQAAIFYRDNYLKYFDSDQYAIVNRNRVTAKNTSGIVGVGRYATRNKDGKKSFYWQASWTDEDDKRKSVFFFIKNYGERKAKMLACQARENAMKKIASVLSARNKQIIKKWESESKKYIQPKEEKKPRASSGTFGVCRYTKISQISGIKYVHWLAFWSDANGISRRRNFSVNVYGAREAKRLACEAREEGIKDVELTKRNYERKKLVSNNQSSKLKLAQNKKKNKEYQNRGRTVVV